MRFTAVPALKLAAGAVPAWRRHLPAALALAALAALVLALAKPQKTVAVPVERASIMLVTDHSRSMSATDVEPDRLSAAQRAARTFLDQLPDQVRVGVVAFSDTPDAVQAPSADHDDARRIVDGQVADGATATGEALEVALDALKNDKQNGKRPPSAIVLLSDGKTTVPPDPVPIAPHRRPAEDPDLHRRPRHPRRHRAQSQPVRHAAARRARPADAARRSREVSGGKAFTAEDSDSLKSIYKTLGSQLGTKKQKKQITASFAIGGLVLLLGAGVALAALGRAPALVGDERGGAADRRRGPGALQPRRRARGSRRALHALRVVPAAPCVPIRTGSFPNARRPLERTGSLTSEEALMHRPFWRRRLAPAALVAALALAGAASAQVVQLPPNGQVNNDPAAGIDPNQNAGVSDVVGGSLDAGRPARAVGHLRAEGRRRPAHLRARVQERRSGSRRAQSLNIDQNVEAEAPSIDFAGAGRTVPWDAWYEPNAALGGENADLRQPLRGRQQHLAARGAGPWVGLSRR